MPIYEYIEDNILKLNSMRGYGYDGGDEEQETSAVVEWEPNTDYTKDTLLLSDNNMYIALSNYTSTTSIKEDLHNGDLKSIYMNGSVFVSDVRAKSSDNTVSEKQFSSDGNVLEYCISDTKDVVIEIIALSGHSNYIPNIYINEQLVDLTSTSSYDNSGIFHGELEINLDNDTAFNNLVFVEHEDGPVDTVEIVYQEPPQIQTLEFSGGYPGEQTELKENDTFDLFFISDQDVVEIEVADEGAAQPKTETFNATDMHTITIDIADRGNVLQELPAKARVRTSFGFWSEWVYTDDFGTTDGTYRVRLNNLKPTINLSDIQYPTGQEAIKESEEAVVVNTIDDFDEVTYRSPNNSLEITNRYTYEENKIVTRDTNLNLESNNIEIEAKRNANGSRSIKRDIVKVLNVSSTIDIESPDRLRSSSSGRSHTIKIKSNHQLIEPPTVDAMYGQWEGQEFTEGDGWERDLTIYDDDPKGIYEFSNLVATNIAGITTNVINSGKEYEIGGFATRRISFAPFTPTASIGTSVADTSKLKCIDIGGNEFSYKSNDIGAEHAYTIIDEDGYVNNNGEYIKILDDGWVSSNSSGDRYVDLEELV